MNEKQLKIFSLAKTVVENDYHIRINFQQVLLERQSDKDKTKVKPDEIKFNFKLMKPTIDSISNFINKNTEIQINDLLFLLEEGYHFSHEEIYSTYLTFLNECNPDDYVYLPTGNIFSTLDDQIFHWFEITRKLITIYKIL